MYIYLQGFMVVLNHVMTLINGVTFGQSKGIANKVEVIEHTCYPSAGSPVKNVVILSNS